MSRSAIRTTPGPVARLLIVLVRVYQWLPKSAVPRCRFAPTCSGYALEALRMHGALRGSWLIVRRLLRCQPFHPGGLDHVPPRPGRTPAGARPGCEPQGAVE